MTWCVSLLPSAALLRSPMQIAQGLGKTIQSLGLILAKPASGKPRGTLIVVPLALKEQWRTVRAIYVDFVLNLTTDAQEIETKCSADLRVLVHHGSSRTKCEICSLLSSTVADRCAAADKLMKYDVVITTYDVRTPRWLCAE